VPGREVWLIVKTHSCHLVAMGIYSSQPIDKSNLSIQYDVIRHVGKWIMDISALSEPVLLVLLSLAEQPRHGYSILKDIESMSGGRVLLSTGTLYGALQRLLDQGWIERIEEDQAPRDRRTYRLTSRGRRNLQMEIERMRHLTKVAALRMARKEA
jgi:DNA-binding PadR family transcriptional regulator